jgi:SAM-dependent methyltransferase
MSKRMSSANCCRFCESADCQSLGDIADSDMFAGGITTTPLFGGKLWHCELCDSQFRHPVLSENDYLKLYTMNDSEVWEDIKLRKDQTIVRSAVSRAVSNGKVLDVGCFAAQFLSALPETYEKFGVEPSLKAAESAKNKGIKILGETISDVSNDMQFDCIVSIDVLEHMLNPVIFIEKSIQLLRPNGALIISTGNPSSFAWRHIFKSRFWYVTNAEHISFLSQKFIKALAIKNGCEVTEVVNFKYADIGLKRALVKLLGQSLFAISPRLYSLMRGKKIDNSKYPSIYSLGVFTDHHVITIRKPV